MRAAILILAVIALALRPVAAIAPPPFCPTGPASRTGMGITKFCGPIGRQTCQCSQLSQNNICNEETGVCQIGPVCTGAFWTSRNVDYVEPVIYLSPPSGTNTLQQCACACKNNTACDAFYLGDGCALIQFTTDGEGYTGSPCQTATPVPSYFVLYVKTSKYPRNAPYPVCPTLEV